MRSLINICTITIIYEARISLYVYEFLIIYKYNITWFACVITKKYIFSAWI